MSEKLNSSLSLYQLLTMVDDAVQSALPSSYWVRAEVLNVFHKGYYRLELSSYEGGKEAKANAMIWQSRAELVTRFEKQSGTRLAKGLKILIRLDVAFDAQYGLRLTVQEFDPAFSLGDMEARLNAIRARLTELGEIRLNRHLPEPRDFTRVAVVSPQGAAGLGDFRTQADALQASGLCDFSYFPALFQGNKNESSIISALQQVIEEHQQQKFDALVVIRGGGDKAGLYELNKMKIARGICRVPMPVLVGVGHERDKTILDELALRSFPTPSLVVAHILNAVIDNARGAAKDYLQMQKQASLLLESARKDCHNYNERLLRFAFDTLGHTRKLTVDRNLILRTQPLDLLQAARRSIDNLNSSVQRNAETAVNSSRSHLLAEHALLRHGASTSLTQAQGLTLRHRETIQRNAETAVNSSRAHLLAEHALLMHGASTSLTQAQEVALRHRETIMSGSRELLLKQRHLLAQHQQAMMANIRAACAQARHAVQQYYSTIDLLNPARVLERGFALVFTKHGEIVTNSSTAIEKKHLTVKLRDGEVRVQAESMDRTKS